MVPRTLPFSLKLIALLCLCLGFASSVFGAAPTCPTTGTDLICVTTTGTLSVLSGPDPLKLAGGTFTAVSVLNAVGAPPNPGTTATYSNVSLTLGVSTTVLTLTCTPSATVSVTATPTADSFNVTSCPLVSNSSFTTSVNFPGNTVPSPIPLAFPSTSLTSGSQAVYICGLPAPYCTTLAPTTLGINNGSIVATCIGCGPMTLTPPGPLTFAGQAGGTPPPSQNVTVGTGSAVLDYAVTTSTTSGGNWLTVNPGSGQSGGTISISANPSTLAAGTYTGTVKVYTAASNSPQTISVTFNVTSAPFNIIATPSSFSFNWVTGQVAPTAPLAVTTSPASSVPFSTSVSTTDGNPWLSVSPSTGTTGGASVTVKADPTKVPTGGTYTGSITITVAGATNNPLVVPVTFKATAVTPSPTSLTFSGTANGPNPPSQTLNVTSTSSLPAVSYTAVASGGTWLSVSPTSGTSNGAGLTVSVNIAGLASGNYTGNIAITPSGATTPINVPVSLALSNSPTMIPSPSSLTFTSSAGVVPASQNLGLTSSGAAISYTVAANTSSGGSWLKVSPASGTTPGSEAVSIDPTVLAGLATGTYTGNVVFTATTSAGNSPLSVPVTLFVKAALTPQPSSLTFNYTLGGSTPPAQPVAVTSNGAPITYTAAASTSSGGAWLAVSPTSATTPTGISVSLNSAVLSGLAAGTYTGTITLTSSGASNSPVLIPVTLNASSKPTLNVTPPGPLTFNMVSLGGLPSAQNLSVTASGGAAIPFTATATTTSGGSWLSASPTSGTTPGSVSVSILANTLAAGTYNGSVQISSTGASNTVTVLVQLTVTAAPTLTLTPGSLTFNYQLLSGTNPPSQPVSVTASGGATIPITATASTTSGGNWLSVSSSGANSPATLTVSVNPAGLAAGTYSGTVTVTSAQASNSPQKVTVTFTVNAAPVLQTSVNSLTFAFQTGGSNPSPQSIGITSSGSALNYTAAASTTSGGAWLSVSPGSGTTPGTVSVSVNATGLAANTYTGTITISSSGASNTPVLVPVTLTVSSLPALTTAPSSLTFNYTLGGSVPPMQPVAIGSTGTPLPVSASTATTWLSVALVGNTTPATMNVTLNPTGLAAGTYNGTITLTSAGASNSPLSYPVTLNVTSQPTLQVNPTSLTFSGQAGGVNPSAQALTINGVSGTLNFTATPATTSGGSWLSVAPGSGTTNASVNVSVNTAGLAAGTYNGTITIAATGASNTPVIVPVTLTLSASALTAAPTSLTFSYQVGGTTPAAQSLALGSTGVGLSFTAASGASWLIVAPGSGATPATLSISVNPSGLAPNTYSSSVTITSTGASNSPLVVPVTFTVVSQPSLKALPSTLTFSYGGTLPAAQSFALSTSDGSTPAFSASASTTSGGNWLAVVPTSGNAPASLTVSVTPGSLAAGTYNGTITASASGYTSAMVAVTLTVTKAKATIVISGNTSFGLANTGAAATSTLSISASDGSALPFTVAAGPATASWLTFTPTSGTTPGSVTIKVNPAGQTPGLHIAELTVSVPGTSDGQKVVSVQLTITGSNLSASPNLLTFTYQPGAALPPSQALTITPATGTTPVSLASVTTDASWIKVTTAASAPATVQVSISPGLLSPGTYGGQVVITGAGSPTASLVIPVMLTVNTLPSLTATPTSLSFTYQMGGTVPAAQSFALSTDTSQLNFTVTAPGTWLSASPLHGTTPGSVLVSVNPVGLGVGTYNGTIKVSAYGANNPVSVPVLLTVTNGSALQVTPSQLTFNVPPGGTAPAQTVSVTAGSALSFTTVATPAWLSVTPTGGTTPATISVSVNAAGLQNGTYTGTITISPAGTGASQTVAVTLQVGTPATPTISTITDSASYTAGTVAPGMAVSIFGSALGPKQGVVFVAPQAGGTLATTLGGTQVLFDGTPVALLYASDGQVNALAPFAALAGKTTTVVQVEVNGVKSAGMTLQVAPSAPGLFTLDGSGKGQGAILNADSSVNGSSHPAPAGSVIVLFGTGGGQTIPPSVDGGINPLNAEGKLALPVTVTIGGQDAQVAYAGPAPGLVAGIMQINATIPSGTPSGATPVIVKVGTATSAPVTVAVQ